MNHLVESVGPKYGPGNFEMELNQKDVSVVSCLEVCPVEMNSGPDVLVEVCLHPAAGIVLHKVHLVVGVEFFHWVDSTGCPIPSSELLSIRVFEVAVPDAKTFELNRFVVHVWLRLNQEVEITTDTEHSKMSDLPVDVYCK